MSKDVATLDDMIRAKAEKSLRAELKKQFGDVLGFFPGHTNADSWLDLPESSTCIASIQPNENGEPVVKVDIRKLLGTLETHAFDLHKAARGNEAVSEFLSRVEYVEEVITDLRSGVAE